MPRGRRPPIAPARLRVTSWPAAIYAVGDIHGCREALIRLEEVVLADAGQLAGEKWMIMLGDYIDRGPDTAAVIDHLLRPLPAGLRRICLRGNHEQMMLDFLDAPQTHAYWLDEGGTETLASYGVDSRMAAYSGRISDRLLADIRTQLPRDHLDFVANLPILLELPGWLFVHAGIRPGVHLERQSDEDLIWIREPFLESDGLPGYRVVHGHTPVDEPQIRAARIGIDTGCYATGRLTALRITPDGDTRLFTVKA